MKFDFICSTGRTATTWIAAALNKLPQVTACHEGYVGPIKDAEPLLPLINLENAQAYALPRSATQIVADKRSPQVLAPIIEEHALTRVIDVAYYNAVLAIALLEVNPTARMVGIIRNCGDFVRSATCIAGEDLLPVGWPDPDKSLTDREKFIELGRIRPRRGTEERNSWVEWSAIQRNIWLWQETNLALAQAQKMFPDRVRLCRFETFRDDPEQFWSVLGKHFELTLLEANPRSEGTSAVNKKRTGYQVGPTTDWRDEEQVFRAQAQEKIEDLINYDC